MLIEVSDLSHVTGCFTILHVSEVELLKLRVKSKLPFQGE